LTDKQKTLLLFAAHFAPALPFIVVGAFISWHEGAALARAYGAPSLEGVKNLLLTVKIFVIIPSLAIIGAYIFCHRVRRRVHKSVIDYAAWLILGLVFSFLAAVSGEGTSMAVVDGEVRAGLLIRELSSVTLYFLAWLHLFIIPWVLLFAFVQKRLAWFMVRPSVEARIITSNLYDRVGITTPGPLPRPWKKKKRR